MSTRSTALPVRKKISNIRQYTEPSGSLNALMVLYGRVVCSHKTNIQRICSINVRTNKPPAFAE